MQATTLSTLHSYLTCCSGATCSTALVPLHLATDAEGLHQVQATILSSTHSYHALGCYGATCGAALVLLHLAKDAKELHQVQATTLSSLHSYLAPSSGATSGAALVLLAKKDSEELLHLDSVVLCASLTLIVVCQCLAKLQLMVIL